MANATCLRCGGSGCEPEDRPALEARKFRGREREDVERHLRGRPGSFQAIDAVLGYERERLMDEACNISDGILGANGWLMEAAKAKQAQDPATALIYMSMAAAECVWAIEDEGFPEREDVIAWYRAAADEGPEDGGGKGSDAMD